MLEIIFGLILGFTANMKKEAILAAFLVGILMFGCAGPIGVAVFFTAFAIGYAACAYMTK